MKTKFLLLFVLALCISACNSPDYSSPEALGKTMESIARSGDKDAFIACFVESDQDILRASLTKSGKSVKNGNMKFVRTEEVVFGESTFQVIFMNANGFGETYVAVNEAGEWKLSTAQTVAYVLAKQASK